MGHRDAWSPNWIALAKVMGISGVTTHAPDAVAEARRATSQQEDVAHAIRIPRRPKVASAAGTARRVEEAGAPSLQIAP